MNVNTFSFASCNILPNFCKYKSILCQYVSMCIIVCPARTHQDAESPVIARSVVYSEHTCYSLPDIIFFSDLCNPQTSHFAESSVISE